MSTGRKIIGLAAFLIAGGLCPPAMSTEWHVCPSGCSFTSIQAAIESPNVVDGDVIVIHDGVWTGPDNTDLRTYGKAITIRSLNDDPNHYEPNQPTIIDCGGPVVPPQPGHRAFIFDDPNDSRVTLQGIKFIRGYQWDVNQDGAAIRCVGVGGSPKIIHCLFGAKTADPNSYGNWADGMNGGAIACVNGASPTLTYCYFGKNVANLGGAIHRRGLEGHN